MRLIGTEGPDAELSQILPLISAHQTSPKMVDNLAKAIRMALRRVDIDSGPMVIEYDRLENILIVFPDFSVGLYTRTGIYSIKDDNQ